MGTVAKQFSSSVPPAKAAFGTDVVFAQFINKLETNASAEAQSRAVVPGALRGLSGLLEHFDLPCTCPEEKPRPNEKLHCQSCRVLKSVMILLGHKYATLTNCPTRGALP